MAGDETDQFGKLSPRAREANNLLAEGKTQKEVAGIMGISKRTVEHHRAKGGFHTLAKLAKAVVASISVMPSERKIEELASRYSTLGAREREVLGLAAQGHKGSSIAHEMGISPKTVQSHSRSIRRKMGAGRLAEAVWMLNVIERAAGRG